MDILKFSASGKLLLFGEYLVLRGANCLSIPLKVGQECIILPHSDKGILWHCFEFKERWMEVQFSKELEILSTSDQEKAQLVKKLLHLIKEQVPSLKVSGHHFQFTLDFNRQLGLGTSSTLISLLHQWSGVDPYFLLAKTFGGSGYDIATATAEKPLLYSIEKKVIDYCTIPEDISSKLLFIYLGNKQKSATEVARFKNRHTTTTQIEHMNTIVSNAAQCQSITDWEKLMQESENLLSSILNISPVKKRHFPDYPFAIKSLGAWGGDFVMATCRNTSEAKDYFKQKHKQTVYTYDELIKQK